MSMLMAAAASIQTWPGFQDDIVVADMTYEPRSESSACTIYVRRLSAQTGEVLWSYKVPSTGRISDNTVLRAVVNIRMSVPNGRVWFNARYRYKTTSGRVVNEAVCLDYATGALISRAYATFCPDIDCVSKDGLTVLGRENDEDDEYLCKATTSVTTLGHWGETSTTSYYATALGIAADGTCYYSLKRVPSGNNQFTIYEYTTAAQTFYTESLSSGSPVVYLWDIDHGYCLMGGEGAHPNGLYTVDRTNRTFTKVKNMAYLSTSGVYFKDLTHLGSSASGSVNILTLRDCESGQTLKTYEPGLRVNAYGADPHRNVYFVSGDTLYRYGKNDQLETVFTSQGTQVDYRSISAFCCEPASFITHPDLYA